jgi:dipeptidase E
VPLGGLGLEGPGLLTQVLALSSAERPRLCYLPTASGDPVGAIEHFHELASTLPVQATDCSLFRRDERDLRDLLLSQDAIYVGGGNTANMLAVWRVHGVDVILREAWERGVVLTGASAGAICWFEDGVTDSYGPTLARLGDGLGFLAGSFCPHLDSEEQRRPVATELVAIGAMVPGLAADDGAGIVFEGTEPVGVIRSLPHAGAYRVTAAGISPF